MRKYGAVIASIISVTCTLTACNSPETNACSIIETGVEKELKPIQEDSSISDGFLTEADVVLGKITRNLPEGEVRAAWSDYANGFTSSVTSLNKLEAVDFSDTAALSRIQDDATAAAHLVEQSTRRLELLCPNVDFTVE